MERRNKFDAETGEFLYPEHPSMDAVEAETEVLRMVTRGPDSEVAAAVGDVVAVVSNESGKQRWVDLKALMQVIREWRSGKVSTAATSWLREVEALKAPR